MAPTTTATFGSALVASMIIFALLVAPYTKVEESFNMQAVHDLLAYGVRRPVAAHVAAHYDHAEFAGAVPRTFVGAVALAAAGTVPARLLPLRGEALQTAVRGILGLWNAWCLAVYADGVAAALGGPVALLFAALTACQFHVVFYASRTLPNFFALGPVLLALRDLLPVVAADTGAGAGATGAETTVRRRRQRSLVLLTVVGIVFRSEIAAFLACHTLNELWNRRLTFVQVAQAGVVGLTLGLGLTVPLDSMFWGKTPLWPELTAFIFNVVEGMSENWGVSPWHYYFTNSLPKLLFNPMTFLVGIPVAFWKDQSRRTLNILLPNLAYVAIMSFQGHKEWRFIIYVIPSLTTIAAVGLDFLRKVSAKSEAESSEKKLKGRGRPAVDGQQMAFSLLNVATIGSILLSLVACYAAIIISSLNYPGAVALQRFHDISSIRDQAGTTLVHADVASCMTGITRFLQLPDDGTTTEQSDTVGPYLKWKYSKEENETILKTVEFWENIDYAITSNPEQPIGSFKLLGKDAIVTTLSGFVLTKSVSDLQRQYENAYLAGNELSGDFSLSNLGQLILMLWNKVGLLASSLTKGRWLTLRMEPHFYIVWHDRRARV